MNLVGRCALLIYGFGWPFVVQWTISTGDTCAMIALSDGETLNVKDLHGKWPMEGIYACDGKSSEIMDLRGKLKYTLVIPSNDRINIEIEGVKVYEWDSEYDVKKTPVWIDLTPRLPHEQKAKMNGLLKFDGDELIIHLGDLGSGVRPPDFKQQKGLSSILFRCKRANGALKKG
jgi:uncharacterized protein (TIGR03067 family)